jgi:mRNA interferase RelE/StbE
MRLEISRSALDFVLALDAKPFRQVMRKILLLLTTPMPNDAFRLRGYDGYWRADIGEYRIIYQFDETVVSIHTIGRRNDDEVYREFERKVH